MLRQPRSTPRRQPYVPNDEARLVARMEELAGQFGRLRLRPHSALGYRPPAPEGVLISASAAGSAGRSFDGCRTHIGSGINGGGRSHKFLLCQRLRRLVLSRWNRL